MRLVDQKALVVACACEHVESNHIVTKISIMNIMVGFPYIVDVY